MLFHLEIVFKNYIHSSYIHSGVGLQTFFPGRKNFAIEGAPKLAILPGQGGPGRGKEG